MSLRTKLVVAFLVLAIVPLSGLVTFSYLSSVRAMQRAVMDESRQLTEQIEGNMVSARAEVMQRFRQVEQMAKPRTRTLLREIPSAETPSASEPMPTAPVAPATAVAGFPGPPPAVAPELMAGVEEAMAHALDQLGDGGGWFRSFAMIPTPGADPDGAAESAAAETSAPPMIFYRGEAPPPVAVPDAAHPRSAWHLRELAAVNRRVEAQLAKVSKSLEKSRKQAGGGEAESAAAAIASAREAQKRALEDEMTRLRAQSEELEKVLGHRFSADIEGWGRLDAEVDLQQFFRRVLARTRRDNGEVPFALGEGNEVFASNDEDRDRLLSLTGGDQDALAAFLHACHPSCERRGWILATRRDPDSAAVFGIARPISDSLAQIRRATGRNLLLGMGMISFALLGILPLSGRLTRGLQALTGEANRLAAGERDVRASVSGSDELGQLGAAFNRMATEIEDQRVRLIEEERRAQAHEVERRLLEAENRRRGEELEEARRFQLSMLPKAVPAHAGYEIAVFMRTATEVGGDYYDFRSFPPAAAGSGADNADGEAHGPLMVAIGDATGHGARAGTMVTVIKTLFATIDGTESLEQFLAGASRSVRAMALDRMTMALAVMRLEGPRLEVASAGMPPPLVYRAGSGRVEEIPVSGLPLGAMSETSYRGRCVELAAGDAVLLMSDGFPELRPTQEEPDAQTGAAEIGYARIRDLYGRIADAPADGVIESLQQELDRLLPDSTPADDVTFVALRRRTDSVREPAAPEPFRSVPA